MQKLQEIEQKLSTINDAVFQNICDDILFAIERGFDNLDRTGSQSGKQKTVKGTPDAYFTYPNGRYVFVEYTTKEKKDSAAAFLKKIIADIDKCTDEAATGIPVEDIVKIIYCHNSRLTTKETKRLLDHCRGKGVRLELKGIDQLALLLLGRAAHTARLFLGISIDTAQILPLSTFVKEYESSGLATVLSNSFIGRETELQDLLRMVTGHQITILTGAPGTGKTRLAVAMLEMLRTERPETIVYCISNKDAPLYEDLRTHLHSDNHVVLFIDDANRQSGNMRSILAMLKETRNGSLRVIATVRDYAYQQLSDTCAEFKTDSMILKKPEDELLIEILKSKDFNIQNGRFIKRILEIADGNPRLTIMAANVALKTQDLMQLHDASEIYDRYFHQAIPDKQLFKDSALLKSLGLLAFFHAIDLTDQNHIERMLSVAGLDLPAFHGAAERLERMELVESNADYSIIKIAEQVLGTFFFYKVFLKDKLIDFGSLLGQFFETHKSRVKDMVIPANNIFGYEQVMTRINPSLDDYWKKNNRAESKALLFLETFWHYRSENVFDYVWEYVKGLPDAGQIFELNEDPKPSLDKTDKLLELLFNYFSYELPQKDTALELSLEYVKKVPGQFTPLIKALKGKFAPNYDDQDHKFIRQRKLIDLLNGHFEEPLYRKTFYLIAPEFLKMAFQVYVPQRKKNSVGLSQFTLPASTATVNFRKKIWLTILKYFHRNRAASVNFFDDYLTISPDWEPTIMLLDVPYVTRLLSRFKPTEFYECYLVRRAVWWFNRKGAGTLELSALKEKFYNLVYQQYRIMSLDWVRERDDHEFEDHNAYAAYKDEELKNSYRFKDISDFKAFYDRYIFLHDWSQTRRRHHNFAESVDVILNAVYLCQPGLGLQILSHIIKAGNPSSLNPYRLLQSFFENSERKAQFAYKELLDGAQMQEHLSWTMAYYYYLQDRYISKTTIRALLQDLRAASQNFHWFNWELLERYLKHDKKTFLKILKIIVDKVEKTRLHWRADQHLWLNYMDYLTSDKTLMEKAYLVEDALLDHFDFDCRALFLLVDHDKTFLGRYIEQVCGENTYYVSGREYSHLNSIWQYDYAENLLENAFIMIEGKGLQTYEDSFFTAFFSGIYDQRQQRAVKFIKGIIKKYHQRELIMDIVRDIAISALPAFKNDFIRQFLAVNDDLDDFKATNWVESSLSGSGRVNFNLIRMGRWQEVLDILHEITKRAYRYAGHKVYVISYINYYQKQAVLEDRSNFMRD